MRGSASFRLLSASLCVACVQWTEAAPGSGAFPGSVEGLSVEEQVGQLFMPVIDEKSAARYEEHIRSGRLGGGLLRWNRFSAPELRRFTAKLRRWASASPGKVPFLVAVDHEGGALFTQHSFGATVFPGNMALGAAGSAELAAAAAAQSAAELGSFGIRVNFAPVLDVNSDPRNPIIGVRSFGEDPADVARLGAAALRGYRDGGVLAAAKHFPGHGDTDVDSHTGLPVLDRSIEELEAVDLVPFRAAVEAGVPMIMTAHISVPALGTGPLPVTLSSAALRGLLRERLGFDGVIVSDSLTMRAITRSLDVPEAAVRAFLAGCDLLLPGKAAYPPVYERFLEAVRDGRIGRERLAESVRRVLEAKRRMAERRPEVEPDPGLAGRIADAAVTLLRDDASLLPLRPQGGKSLLVIALRPSRFSDHVEGFVRELKRRHAPTRGHALSPNPDEKAAELAVRRARDADFLIVGTYLWGNEPPVAQRRLVRRLLDLGKPTVLVSLMNPYDARHYPAAKTVVLTYGPTRASLSAAARLIFGEIPSKGRLPVTVSDRFRRGSGFGN
ncbi:MAG: glycoside hydrolase family 3 N-terminal domain-containing protein [Elusimicrobiota bacterium]